jgi:phosphonatase-like hydrolase
VTAPFELVALDMAGTTVADDGVVERAFLAALDEVGAPQVTLLSGGPSQNDHPAVDPLAYVRRTMGKSKIDVFNDLYGDRKQAAAANAAFEEAFDHLLARGAVHPLPGSEAVIEELRAAGLRVCLTTGFSPATRDRILAVLKWGGLPDLVLSPADAGRGRPWPDMILTAVLRLEIGDVRAVAVAGDTTSDLWEGHRAGAGVVAGVLSGSQGREELEAAPHTHILHDVSGLPAIVL